MAFHKRTHPWIKQANLQLAERKDWEKPASEGLFNAYWIDNLAKLAHWEMSNGIKKVYAEVPAEFRLAHATERKLPKSSYGLNPKDRLTAHLYSQCGNQSEVARKMRSTQSTVAMRLAKPEVIEYMTYLQQRDADEEVITRQWKLSKIKQVVDACLDGTASKDNIVNANGAITAIAEANKMQGDYAPVKTDESHTISFEDQQFETLCTQYEREC